MCMANFQALCPFCVCVSKSLTRSDILQGQALFRGLKKKKDKKKTKQKKKKMKEKKRKKKEKKNNVHKH